MRVVSTYFDRASGRLGQMVWMTNKSGLCARIYVTPRNPKSIKQRGVRASFKDHTLAWSGTLTQAMRDGWAAYAATLDFVSKLGTHYTISGLDAYVMCNGARLVAGFTRVDTAPTLGGFDTFTSPTLAADASDKTITVTYNAADAWCGEVGGGLVVRVATLAQRVGVTFFEGPFFYKGKAVGAGSPPAGPLVLTMPVGAIAVGYKYFLSLRSVRADGRCSAEGIFQCVAVA